MGRFGDKKRVKHAICAVQTVGNMCKGKPAPINGQYASGVWPGVGCLGLTVLAFAYVKFTILENDATSHSFVTNVESFYITMVSASIVQPSMNLEFIYT